MILSNFNLSSYARREKIPVAHYPPPTEFIDRAKIDELLSLNGSPLLKGEKSIYIHVPFCDKICNFCPFNKQLYQDEKQERFLDALCKEIEIYGQKNYIKNCTFGSLAMGGGTPSCLTSSQIKRLMKVCLENFKFATDAEITMEGNPSNFSEERLKAALEAGVNRVSFGVQSFNDVYAELLEIPQNSQVSEQAIRNARKVGFKNIGIDLIYNLPGQTLDEWLEDVEKAIAFGLDHITMFSLIIPPMTKLYKLIESGRINPPNTIEIEALLYLKAVERLKEAGYVQYTSYDFALPDKINKHAVIIFSEDQDLLALGPAAFGFLGSFMYINNGDLNEYISSINNDELPVLMGKYSSGDERIHGFMVKSLKTLQVDKNKFFQRFNIMPEDKFLDILQKLKEKNLITINDNTINLTENGIFWSNNVCREFFSEKSKEQNIPRELLARGHKHRIENHIEHSK